MPRAGANFTESKLSGWACAAPVVLGWLALYAPVYADFMTGPWMKQENAHAPFILAICLGVGWAKLNEGRLRPGSGNETGLGVLILAAGLALYALGRQAEIIVFTSASQMIVALGVVLSLGGAAGVKRLWFPLALSAYLIVWPGWVIDYLTAPLKIFVSEFASAALYSLGFPVAQSGAVIAVGSYELLVANACSGLNSLIALTATGAVYLFAARRTSLAVNAIVLASLVPLAICANIIRVGILTLITYYAGYDAGQSFLHETAGLAMFAIALAGVFLIDAVAAVFLEKRA